MKVRIFVPRDEEHIQRCLELINRSNQLNLSARSYTEDTFRRLLASNINSALPGCRTDSNYGIVGLRTWT